LVVLGIAVTPIVILVILLFVIPYFLFYIIKDTIQFKANAQDSLDLQLQKAKSIQSDIDSINANILPLEPLKKTEIKAK
jgi:peptidoglycan hydrolase CwlO-like protein